MSIINGVDLSRLPVPVVPARPDLLELYDFTWKTLAGNIRVSRGRRHLDAAWDPARNYQWVWDTCFMAMFCRYGNGQFPGVESLDNFYEMQRADGYISMTYDMTTGLEPWPDRINPPLFAWVEWEHYLATGDSSRFSRVLPHIEKLMVWIDAHRRTEEIYIRTPAVPLKGTVIRKEDISDSAEEVQSASSFYWFEDCGSSGMDDSPRTPRAAAAGRFFAWIDLSAQMALSFRMLAEMHKVEGNHERAAHWSEHAAALGQAINAELWCERTGFYHDRIQGANFVPSKTAAGFWPVLAGICPEDALLKLAAHLENPATFGRPVPVPTLAADDCNYCPDGTYWLGGVWAPTNYMITRGLMRQGQSALAHRLALKYLDALSDAYRNLDPHTLWESYCPEKPLPGRKPYNRNFVKPDFVGWSGIGPVAMLIENIIGLDLNAAQSEIDWDIRLTSEHGLRNLAVPGGSIDLLCAARESATAAAEVSVSASVPVRVRVRCTGRVRELQTVPGEVIRLQV